MTISKKNSFKLIYVLAFLASLGDGLAGYIQSSYLEKWFSLSQVGLIVSLSAAAALATSGIFPKLIAKFSLYRLFIVLAATDFLASLILSFNPGNWLVFLFFISRYIGFMLIVVVLDVFLESISKDNITGAIRSEYLTVINAAWLASPLLVGQLVGWGGYSLPYLVGAILMALFLILIILGRKKLRIKKIHFFSKKLNLWQTLKTLGKNNDLLTIFVSAVLLNIFYAAAVLYMPIYLNKNIGLAWPTIGWIFTIMLLPFILIQRPAGILADKKWGEKEMLVAGAIIIAAASFIIFLSAGGSAWFWAGLLCFSRIGAALMEVMQEVYFYKKINAQEIGLINFFRQTRNIGWLIGALLAALLLSIMDIRGLFLIIGILFVGHTLQLTVIKDTK